jgi:hypothetical protein
MKFGPTEINYSISPDDQLGIYIRTIGTPEDKQGQGHATKALEKLIAKYPKNKKVTFSSPLSKGGQALTASLVKKKILQHEVTKWGVSNNIFLITKRLSSYEKKHGIEPHPFLRV